MNNNKQMLKEELDEMEKTLASKDTLEVLKQKYQADYYLNLLSSD